jgi:predicted MPP superfamily phosphohydrolase
MFLAIILLTDLWFYWYLSRYKSKIVRGLRTNSLYVGFAFFSFLVTLFLLNPIVADISCANTNEYFFLSFTWLVIWYIPRILLFILIAVSYILLFFSQKLRKRTITIINIFIISLLIVVTLSISLCRYTLKERNFDIYSSNIGESFENYTVVQFSDMHLGTMKNSKSLWLKYVEKINALEPDLIVFTGDLVNNFHTETIGWDSVFSGLKAKDGKIAVLGNHDYGGYAKWKSEYDKQTNNLKIISFLKRNGFTVLENENVSLIKGIDTLIIAGIENWGQPPFPQYGDITKTLQGVEQKPTVLLSHDPDLWEAEVKNKRKNIFLTLSGHTHGFQFGIRSKYINFCPASIRYEYWGGLYKSQNQYLYVNTGIGFVGFKGRIGICPEVSVFKLKNRTQMTQY